MQLQVGSGGGGATMAGDSVDAIARLTKLLEESRADAQRDREALQEFRAEMQSKHGELSRDIHSLSIRFDNLDVQLLNAESRRRNRLDMSGLRTLFFPRKTVPGDGLALVVPIKVVPLELDIDFFESDLTEPDSTQNAIETDPITGVVYRTYEVSDAILQAAPAPAVGDLLPQTHWKPEAKWTSQDILDLVYFYNEDFGIEQGDKPFTRVRKVFVWLIAGPT